MPSLRVPIAKPRVAPTLAHLFRWTRRGAPLLLAAGAMGCGWTAGASPNVWVSHRGRTRVDVEVPVGMDTRFAKANPDDSAGTVSLLLRPAVTYRPDTGRVGAAFGPSVGGSGFDGRLGIAGFLTGGMLLDTAPGRDETSTRFFLRAQARAELETNSGDWRIDELEELDSFSGKPKLRRRTRNHSLAGVVLGIEYLSSEAELPTEWNFGGGLSYRGLFEID
jgi:hypothetical protein